VSSLSFIKNKNYIITTLRATTQLSDEVIKSAAPITADIISKNTKYVNNKLSNIAGLNKNNEYYKSSKELIEDSINALKNDPYTKDQFNKTMTKIKNFSTNNNSIMDYITDTETATDIRNIQNESNVFMKSDIKTTLSIIHIINNNISTIQIERLSKSENYISYINKFNQDKSIYYYNMINEGFKTAIETLTKLKGRLSIISKFEQGVFQVNNKYNQLKTIVNTIDMFGSDYYKSKMLDTEATEVAKNFITDNVPPLISNIANVISQILPAPIKEALNETESLLKITPVILNKKYESMLDSDNHLQSAIGTMFHKKINSQLYDKGNMNYDGITRRSILNAIPSGLAKILNIVNGFKDPLKEKVFDYEKNIFMTGETIYQHAKDEYEFNRNRLDSPINGYKNLVISKLKKEKLFNTSISSEVETAIDKIVNDKLLPSKLVKLSNNDKLNEIMRESYMDLSPYEKTRFMHYVFNIVKTPEEIIGENESYHNVLDTIGLQDIIPERKIDFKNELSNYLIGKNYNGLAAYINQKPDSENPYEPGTALYSVVSGIRSINVLITELLFGVPDGKKSELSIIGEKSLMFVGKIADKAVDSYRTYISSDKRGAKLLKDIKNTGIVKATADYLKLVWTELKENGIGKWTYETLITPIANFAKTHVFDKMADGYKTLVANLKSKASKLDDSSQQNKHVIKKKITLEKVYQIKIKKSIKTVGKSIKENLVDNILNLNNDIKSLNPALSNEEYEKKLLDVFDTSLYIKLKEKQREYDEKHKHDNKTLLTLTSGIVKIMGIVKSVYRGIKAAKNMRPDIEKRTFFEKMKDIIDHGREEKRKRTTTKTHILKNAATIAYNIVDLRLITPFKTFIKVMKENKESIWNIIKNTISIVINFYTKFMIPIKMFNFYKNHVLGVQLFLETKRFAISVRKNIIKEAITTIKEAARINKNFKKVYMINPEYDQVGFVTKNFNIIGGYLDNIYEKIEIDKYLSGYEKGKLHALNEKDDDEKDTKKAETVIEKHKKTIKERIKKRLDTVTDFLKDKALGSVKNVFSGVGSFAKGITGTLFMKLFKNSKTEAIVNKVKNIFKGTKTDINARIEHVYVIGGNLTGGGITGISNIGTGKIGDAVENNTKNLANGKKGKIKYIALIGAYIAGSAYAMKTLNKNEDENEDIKDEKQESIAEPAPTKQQTNSNDQLNEQPTDPNKSIEIPYNNTTSTISLENNVNLKSSIIVDEEITTDQLNQYIANGKIKIPNNEQGAQLKEKSVANENSISATQLQLNSSFFTSSMVSVNKLVNIDAREMRNYYDDKSYNEKIEKEFTNKLTASELEEYNANKNASLLAAKLRMGDKSVIDTLMGKESLGALARGGLSLKQAQRLVDEYVMQSGFTKIKYNNHAGDGGYANYDYSDPNDDGNYDDAPGGGIELGENDLFGRVSQKYETGTSDYTGAAKISSGKGDYGGVSYGIPQFSTTMGSAKSFANWLQTTYPKFGQHLAGLSPGTEAFNRGWRNAYNTDPQGFANAQIAYIVKNETLPFISKIYKTMGVNLNLNRGLQELAHSVVIQHGSGGGPRLMKNAGITSADDPATIINKLYAERSKVHIYFKSSSGAVQNSVKDRFVDERRHCLELVNSPAIDLHALVNGMTSSISSADMDKTNSTMENSINMLNSTLENAVVNKDNIRNIIKNIKSMQILKDDPEVKQLIEIIVLLDKMSNNSSKLANDDNIILKYSNEISNNSNKKILKNVFIGGYEGKLA